MNVRIEVCLDWDGQCRVLGHLRRIPSQGGERVSFAYAPEWLKRPSRFQIDPELPLTAGEHHPRNGGMFGAIGDSAPDRWGRDLMRCRERRDAKSVGRRAQALQEADFLLGVADVSRLGALRFREEGAENFVGPLEEGVPGTISLGRILAASDRIQSDSFDGDDLWMIFASGASLGGARPKASVLDTDGTLMIAKFPKADDEIDIELWEAVTLTLAGRAGIDVAPFRLRGVGGRNVLLSRRFDRDGEARLPFVSAMAMTGHSDGDGDASYLELAEVITLKGAFPDRDRRELFRRIGFSILASNVDDHLRNHGFLRSCTQGWALSPAYDLNPVPPHLKGPVLSTAIDLEDRTADPDLLLETVEDYGLQLSEAKEILRETAEAVSGWRDLARRFGAREAEIEEMRGAFEHDRRARALSF